MVSAGRAEGGSRILEAINAMIAGLPDVRLVELAKVPHYGPPIAPAATPQLHRVIQHGDSDGVAEGVPSVVSDAIDWAPVTRRHPSRMSTRWPVARYLLADPHAPEDGLRALERHNRDGLEA